MKWRDRAACIGQPVDLFFPLPGPHLAATIKQAKAVCAECPVRAECLAYALEFVQGRYITLPGIYGGTTESERWRIASTEAQTCDRPD